jgi:hypothetical protein
MIPFLRTTVSGLLLALANASLAWDYEAHSAINQLALSSLPADFPAFVRTPSAQERIAFLSGEPDRWRNTPDLALRHGNGPDHYFDLDNLAAYDLKPEQLPLFRYDFVAALALFRAAHLARFTPPSPARNEDHTRELPGLLPWALAEQYGKLKSAFAYLRALQAGGTADEIQNAQDNVIYLMGVMGHLAGDASQPLHTTVHHHGWVGTNPRGYTTNGTIHEWIDGGFFGKTGGLDLTQLRSGLRPAQALKEGGQGVEVFEAIVTCLATQNRLVEPLYQLDRDGKLKADSPERAQGRAFLENQLRTGAALLADLWLSAWRHAPEDRYLKGKLAERKGASAPPAAR